jgi:multiple sugar transport system substrate-binding protein
MAAASLAGCTPASGSTDKVQITLEGPNQWNSNPKTFGPAWDALITSFEKDNPKIEVKTTVLPISSWAQTSSTQLTAGTAPELIFAQTPHKPEQILSLNKYLAKPNPFIPGNKRWIDGFNKTFFGQNFKENAPIDQQIQFVPFNLVNTAIYYNKALLKKADVTTKDLSTFGGLIASCKKIKTAGYTPVAADNSSVWSAWVTYALTSMLMDKYKTNGQVTIFNVDGNPGSNPNGITAKALAHAYLTGELDVTKTPVYAVMMKLLKEYTDACVTPNWSGVAQAGAISGANAFLSGTAVMAWGTNFSLSAVLDSKIDSAAIPFPTVTKEDSSYSSGSPARFGMSTGGTSYMIPSYVKGAKRDAAIKFLQYVSSPKVQPWIDKQGGIPAIKGAKTAPGLSSMTTGDWAKLSNIDNEGGGTVLPLPAALAGKNPFEGYLLGSKSLDQTLTTLQSDVIQWSQESAKNNKWTESWATKSK